MTVLNRDRMQDKDLSSKLLILTVNRDEANLFPTSQVL